MLQASIRSVICLSVCWSRLCYLQKPNWYLLCGTTCIPSNTWLLGRPNGVSISLAGLTHNLLMRGRAYKLLLHWSPNSFFWWSIHPPKERYCRQDRTGSRKSQTSVSTWLICVWLKITVQEYVCCVEWQISQQQSASQSAPQNSDRHKRKPAKSRVSFACSYEIGLTGSHADEMCS